MLSYQELIKKAYSGFNNRDIDTTLSTMQVDVRWPRAFEGGYVSGHQAVSAYWTKQWTEINPRVEPLSITQRTDGKIEVKVKQVVKDMEGNVLFDGVVKHIYTLNNGLLQQMDIELS